MKRNFEKNIHIINQVMGYCKKAGASEFETKLVLEDEHTTITVSAPIQKLEGKAIESLRRQLEIPRQPEVEQNYWNIGLSGNMGDEMALVGMMIDTCSISYTDDILTINLERQNQSV